MIKFGTGGWRDYIGDGFSKENVLKVAQAIANLKPKTAIAIGYDHRFLSEDAAKWVAQVLAANNIKVVLAADACPTPFVMLYVKNKKLDYGIAITASHNPYNFNGIKVFTKGGIDASVDFTSKLEKMINKPLKPLFEEVFSLKYKKYVSLLCFNDYYPNHLPKIINLKAITGSKLKVVIDNMHGVGFKGLEPIFNNSKFKLDYINELRDPLFGGRVPAPNIKNLDQLRTKVLKGKYDLGIALDGDADRIGVIDDKGNYLDANRLLALLYYYFLEYENKKGNVIRNLCTTTILDKIASKYGQRAFETKVGYKYISAAMNEYRGLIGGESSGGISMLDHIDGKDSIFATLLILQMLAKTNKKISSLNLEVESKFGKTLIGDTNFSFDLKTKARINDQMMIKKQVPKLPYKVVKTQFIDGLKLDLEDGYWVSLRFSGTEPLLRLYYEVKDKKMETSLVSIFKEFYKL